MSGWAEVTCMHASRVKDGLGMAAFARCRCTPEVKTPKIYSQQVQFSMLDKPTGEWNYLKILRKSERVSGGKRQSRKALAETLF